MYKSFREIWPIRSILFRYKLLRRKQLESKQIINYINRGTINLIDVGSIGGLPDPWCNNSFLIKNLLKFEPLDNESNQKNIVTKDIGLWNTSGDFPFYVYKGFNSTGSSLFEQNLEYVKENFKNLKTIGDKFLAETWFERGQLLRVETIKCDTLDHVLSDLSIKYDFIKIDAQGAEYQILEGGQAFIDETCLGLHLELFNKPLYKSIKLKEDVVEFLIKKGFYLAKEYPPHGTFNSQNDCIFIRHQNGASDKSKIQLIKNIYGI